jgi:phosphoribosylglycinamide formyltransferase-1
VLIDYFRTSVLAQVTLIVCNKPGAGVLQIAEREGIPALLIEKERFFRGDGYVPVLEKAGIQMVVLAGFLWKVPQALLDHFPRRIINIHPACCRSTAARACTALLYTRLCSGPATKKPALLSIM